MKIKEYTEIAIPSHQVLVVFDSDTEGEMFCDWLLTNEEDMEKWFEDNRQDYF